MKRPDVVRIMTDASSQPRHIKENMTLLIQYIEYLEKHSSELEWTLYPDRMGR